jgi:hypothetical protein
MVLQLQRIQQQLSRTLLAEKSFYRWELGNSLGNWANLLQAFNRPEQAEKAHRQTLGLWEKLAGDFPTVPEYQHGLAMAHSDLGWFLAPSSRHEEAEKHYREALALCEKLAAKHPGVPRYRDHLANLSNNLGILLANTRRPKDADKAFEQALTLWRELAEAHPDWPHY